MFDKIKQLLCSHNWVYGKVASSEARFFLKWSCYHNRACTKCDKIDNAAERAEFELTRILGLQKKISRYPSVSGAGLGEKDPASDEID